MTILTEVIEERSMPLGMRVHPLMEVVKLFVIHIVDAGNYILINFKISTINSLPPEYSYH